MSITPLTFTGVSTFSNDFQSILSRAVQIAQLPLKALQNKDTDLLQQKSLLGGFSSAVGGLTGTLTALGTVAGNKALTATSSDTSVIQATANGGSAAATYTIDSVTSRATLAAERSLSAVADSTATAVSATGTVDLVVGSDHHTITLARNNLVGLRDQINALGAGVSASILTTSGGNYLSLNAETTGATTLQLVDDPTGAANNLITNTNQGTDAVFSLNGIPVHQKDNVVNSVIPGVTFTLLKSSATPVTISLKSDGSQLASALSQFVNSYNTVHAQLQAQVGANAGLLSGSHTVTSLQNLTRQIASYQGSGTGSIKNLSDVGITFDANGKASFSASTFNALSGAQLANAIKFAGTANSGLAGYAKKLTQYSDPISGLIKLQQDGIDRSDQSIQKQITTLTDRVNDLQTNLSRRLALADTLASRLESQQKGLTASLQGLNVVLYGKNTTA